MRFPQPYEEIMPTSQVVMRVMSHVRVGDPHLSAKSVLI